MMHKSTLERPLVTFSLFAYNQEKYIREAIEGAFAQTYEPLEIILSDDYSSDDTFLIMKELVAAYSGKHKVYLRRNECNVGTAQHFNNVANESSGELIVVAAGDDVSMPTRVSELYDSWAFQGSPSGLVYSALTQFDEKKRKESYRGYVIEPDSVSLDAFLNTWRMPAHAPSCAYTKDVFYNFPPLFSGSVVEDFPLMFRSILIGMCIYVDKPLVWQRKRIGSAGQGFSFTRRESWNRYIQSKSVALSNIYADAKYAGNLSHKQKILLEKKFLGRELSSHLCIFVKRQAFSQFLGLSWFAFLLA